MTPSEVGDQERDAAALLDKVLRGEIPLIFPPGTIVASLLVPCFAVGAGGLSMFVGLTISKSVEAIAGAMGAGILLAGVATVGNFLVVQGHPNHRIWMRVCVEILLACTVLVGALCALLTVRAPLLLLLAPLASFVSCDLLLRSRAYLAFSSFMSLKRKYREKQKRGLRPGVDSGK